MSVTTKFCFSILALFLLPFFAEAVSVEPQVTDVLVNPGDSFDFSVEIANFDNVSHDYSLGVYSVDLGNGPDDLSFSSLNNKIEFLNKANFDVLTLTSGEKVNWPVSFKVSADHEEGIEVIALEVYEVPDIDKDILISSGETSLLFLTVGDPLNRGELVNFSTTRTQASHLPVEFFVSYRNTGEAIYQPTGEIKIQNIFGKTINGLMINPQAKRVPPGQERSFSVIWGQEDQELHGFYSQLKEEIKDFHFGLYKVILETDAPISGDSSQTFKVVLFPWRTIIVFFGILLVLAGSFVFTRKKSNAYSFK